jgi:GNAT superfamily N-acetyltransferase
VTPASVRIPPADPHRIELTYHHRHCWDDAPGEVVERWGISADIDDSAGDRPVHVGDFEIISVDLYETGDPFGLLDGEEGDLGVIAEVIFDPRSGDLHERLDEFLEPIDERLLILNRARLAPAWQGFGLGALLTGAILRKLSGGARGAVCYPAPCGGTTMDPMARKRAVKALQKTWERLGFTHFRNGVYVLDLHTVALGDAMEALTEQAGSLWPGDPIG